MQIAPFWLSERGKPRILHASLHLSGPACDSVCMYLSERSAAGTNRVAFHSLPNLRMSSARVSAREPRGGRLPYKHGSSLQIVFPTPVLLTAQSRRDCHHTCESGYNMDSQHRQENRIMKWYRDPGNDDRIFAHASTVFIKRGRAIRVTFSSYGH